MELGGLSFFTSNPILVVVLVMDGAMGLQLARSMLHPYVGNFDIALILQPLGDKTDPKAKGKLSEAAILMMANRVEFNPMREAFRVGKKSNAFTYKVDPSQVAFIQRTHRVYYYQKGLAYPVPVGYGTPARTTTSKGMDLYVAQKLWGQAVAATQKLNFSLPIMVAILCVAAGAGVAGAIFFAVHPGFVPLTSIPHNSTTVTLGRP